MKEKDVIIRPVTLADLAAFKDLRLEALRTVPEAFSSDYGERLNDPDDAYKKRIDASIRGEDNRIIVAEINGRLVGMAGCYRDEGVKVRHNANIWGVYVRPEARGRRVAERVIEALIDWAREGGARIVRLFVTVRCTSAIRCYLRCGFQVSGVTHESIRIGEEYIDDLLMWRRV
jgi:ribosomal protein S18 acetylase RimI-like enzyme